MFSRYRALEVVAILNMYAFDFAKICLNLVMNHYSLEPANFIDYRDFLKSRFDAMKVASKNFSLLSCARKSKLSKSHLQFLLNKKRHLTLDKFPGLAKTLKLTNDEEYFVFLMICKDASYSSYVKSHFERILQRIRHQFVITEVAEPILSLGSEKSLYQDAFAMILQTLVRLEDFKEDPKWISKILPIQNLSEEKIQLTLSQLEKMGAISRDEDGKLKAKEMSLWRPDPYDPTGFSVYTKGAEAIADLMKTPNVYRPSVYMSMSLAMDEENLLAAEKFMIEVHHRLSAFAANSKNPTATVFIGNYFLTLARMKNQEKSQ